MLQLAALASLLFLAPAQDKPKPAEDAEETVAARKGNLTPVFELEAVYEAIESVELKMKLEAYQGELSVLKVAPAGELVKKGDLLLSLDTAAIDKQIAAIENDLKVARAMHEKLQAELSIGAKADALALLQAQTAVKDSETSLKSFEEVDGKHMIQMVELQAKFTEDALHDQTEELAQLEKMYKSEELTNATSEIVVRRARRNLDRTKVALDMARLEAGNVKNVRYPQQRNLLAHAIEVARNALDGVKAAQTLSKVQREVEAGKAKAALAQLEEQAAKLKHDLANFSWRAPLDGRVFYGQFQHGAWATSDQVTPMMAAGEKLQPGQVLLTVCGPATRARADLAEADYFDVAPGLAATVVPAAQPDAKAEGTIRSKSPVAAMKGTGSAFELRIEFKEPPSDLLPGMKGKATIKGAELKDVVLVPSQAIAAQAGKCMLT
ncbi:MAG: HlyD family efflux transporter periplasmic adaptor subunit, partial [Planctomycetes bacterium]|nr:HlyD family efflux transporter periplasmic adaptor subunit [Planctomycetota bacterium]